MEIGKELYETALIHEKGTVQPPLYISTWITQLLYKLSLSAVPPIEENAPISEAIRYILAHVGEPITLDDLSQLTNFSPYYLSHLFKKQTGYSPSEYIINTRLEKAQRLLTHSRGRNRVRSRLRLREQLHQRVHAKSRLHAENISHAAAERQRTRQQRHRNFLNAKDRSNCAPVFFCREFAPKLRGSAFYLSVLLLRFSHIKKQPPSSSSGNEDDEQLLCRVGLAVLKSQANSQKIKRRDAGSKRMSLP